MFYLALLERLSSLGLCLDPVPTDKATAALVLFGCWCKTSSSFAVVPSVSSLYIQTESHSLKFLALDWNSFFHIPIKKMQHIYLQLFFFYSESQEVTTSSLLQTLSYYSVISLTWTMATSSWSCRSFCFAVCRWTFWTKPSLFPRLLLRLDPDASLSGAKACAPSSLPRPSSSSSSSFTWL